MKTKGSYLAKHLAKTTCENGVQPFAKMHSVLITEEQRAAFEAGKVLLIDKPLHWTSFDVVRKIRNSIKIKKVGHAGTLDPLATGLLIVCTGKFTKKINEYMAQVKEYTGSFTLGATTPTYDKESELQDHKPYHHITAADIKNASQKFMGEIEQFPPIYSAIKKEGMALYELARRGVHVELKARKITINEFEITQITLPVLHFRIVCSTGTYIRSIAHDMGAALNTGAYLSELRRTKIGDNDVENGVTMQNFLESLV